MLNAIATDASPGAFVEDVADGIVIEELQSLDAIAGRVDEVTRLIAAHGRRTPFNDLSRYRVTVSALGGAVVPRVVLFHRVGRLAGVLVGRIVKRRVRCRVGYVPLRSPRLRCLDVVYGGAVAADELVVAAMGEYLLRACRSRRIDHVLLNKLPSDMALSAVLSGQPRVVVQHERPHWCLRLEQGSYERSIARLSRKHRYNMRRMERRFVEAFDGNVELECVRDVAQVQAFVRTAAEVTAKTYQAALGGGVADNEVWRARLRADGEAGGLCCFVLRGGGVPIAFQAGVIIGDTYFLEATAFAPEHGVWSPGTVLLLLVVQELCKGHVTTIDYGFGDAPYKQMYGSESWSEASVHIYGSGIRSRASWVLDAAARHLTAVAVKRAARSGRLHGLKRRWRERLRRDQS